jgi:hypothetical protein
MLYRGSDHYGYVYIRTETYIRRRGGHLWWRAWDTGREVPAGFMVLTDGTFDDFIVGSEHLDHEVSDWDSGRFPYRGEASGWCGSTTTDPPGSAPTSSASTPASLPTRDLP